MKQPTKKQLEAAYKIVQSYRGKKSAKSGMSMSERGKLGAKVRKANKEKALLDISE